MAQCLKISEDRYLINTKSSNSKYGPSFMISQYLNPLSTSSLTSVSPFLPGLHTTLSQRRANLRAATLEAYQFTPLHTHDTLLCDVSRDQTESHDDTEFSDVIKANAVISSPHEEAVRSAQEFISGPTLRTLLDIAQENLSGFDSISVLEVGGLTQFRRYVILLLDSGHLELQIGKLKKSKFVYFKMESNRISNFDSTNIIQILQTTNIMQLLTEMAAMITHSSNSFTKLRSKTEEVLNCNPGRPACSYSVAVMSEKELLSEEQIKCFVWDVTQQEIDASYDVIVTSWAACGGMLGNVLSCLKPEEGFLVLLNCGEEKLDNVGECVASRSSSVGTLSLIRNTRENVSE